MNILHPHTARAQERKTTGFKGFLKHLLLFKNINLLINQLIRPKTVKCPAVFFDKPQRCSNKAKSFQSLGHFYFQKYIYLLLKAPKVVVHGLISCVIETHDVINSSC